MEVRENRSPWIPWKVAREIDNPRCCEWAIVQLFGPSQIIHSHAAFREQGLMTLAEL